MPPSISTEARPRDAGHLPVAGIDLGGTKVRGAIADATGRIETGFWFTGFAMIVSGVWLIFAMEETHPRRRPARDHQ